MGKTERERQRYRVVNMANFIYTFHQIVIWERGEEAGEKFVDDMEFAIYEGILKHTDYNVDCIKEKYLWTDWRKRVLESRAVNKELGSNDKKKNAKAFKPYVKIYEHMQELSKPIIIGLQEEKQKMKIELKKKAEMKKEGKDLKDNKDSKEKKDKKKGWVPKLGLGFGKSKKSKKDARDKEQEEEEFNSIMLVGDATFREESFISEAENDYNPNPDQSPIGVSDRDGMNIYGRPRVETENINSKLRNMERSKSASSKSKASSEGMNDVTISVAESYDATIPDMNESQDGDLTKNQHSMMKDLESFMEDSNVEGIRDSNYYNDYDSFGLSGGVMTTDNLEELMRSPVAFEKFDKNSLDNFRIDVNDTKDTHDSVVSEQETKFKEEPSINIQTNLQDKEEIEIKNKEKEKDNEQLEVIESNELQMSKKSTAELIITEPLTLQNPSIEIDTVSDSQLDQPQTDDSIESGEPFNEERVQEDNKDSNHESSSEESYNNEELNVKKFTAVSDDDDSGILDADDSDKASDSISDDVDALLEDYEENEFIGMDDDNDNIVKRKNHRKKKSKKSKLQAIQEEENESEQTDGSSNRESISMHLKNFLESNETAVEARNSLLKKGFSDADVIRMQELRSSIIEAKEYKEMKKKYDPNYQTAFTNQTADHYQNEYESNYKYALDQKNISLTADIEHEPLADETMDFVNMIANGYNDIVDLGEKLQGKKNENKEKNNFSNELGIEESNFNSSAILGKFSDANFIQNELSRITFLHNNDDIGIESNLRNCKIKIETFPADYDLEGNIIDCVLF